MNNKHCSSCNSLIIPARGNSELLIVGSAPDDQDIRKGSPFSSSLYEYTTGKVLRKELERVGLSLQEFRIMHLWQHAPNNSEECFKAGFDTVLLEAKGKKAILLLGADAVETFTGYKVSEVSGLRVDSSILSAPLIMAGVNPSLALARAIGEVRFMIERWKYNLEKENLI